MMAVLFSDILGVNVPLGYTTRRTVPVLVSDKQDESVEVDEISSVILIAALNLPFLAGMFPAHAASPKLKDLIAGAKKKMQATRKSDKESTQVWSINDAQDLINCCMPRLLLKIQTYVWSCSNTNTGGCD